MAVTLKDIAAKTNVSVTAISHVLNNRLGHVRVSSDKQKEIRRVATELGYVPNLNARSMVARKSHTLGVLGAFPDMPREFGAEYFLGVLRGVEAVCASVNYNCLFVSSRIDDPSSFEPPRAMKDGSVDGVVLVGYSQPEVVKRVASLRLPCVQVGSNIDPALGVDCVYADLDPAFREAAGRLVAMGHRRVQLLLPTGPGPKHLAENFLSLANEIDGLEPEVWMFPDEISTPEQASVYARQILDRPSPPTAFICSLVHAQSLADGLSQAGWSCPADYSLVSFGAESAERQLYPGGVPLSMIKLPTAQTGKLAAERLLSQLGVIENASSRKQGNVPCEVHFRGSCTSRRRIT